MRDISERYADRLERRLRFNMARLWLVFGERAIDPTGNIVEVGPTDAGFFDQANWLPVFSAFFAAK